MGNLQPELADVTACTRAHTSHQERMETARMEARALLAARGELLNTLASLAANAQGMRAFFMPREVSQSTALVRSFGKESAVRSRTLPRPRSEIQT